MLNPRVAHLLKDIRCNPNAYACLAPLCKPECWEIVRNWIAEFSSSELEILISELCKKCDPKAPEGQSKPVLTPVTYQPPVTTPIQGCRTEIPPTGLRR